MYWCEYHAAVIDEMSVCVTQKRGTVPVVSIAALSFVGYVVALLVQKKGVVPRIFKVHDMYIQSNCDISVSAKGCNV